MGHRNVQVYPDQNQNGSVIKGPRGSEFVTQDYESADPGPDLKEIFTDPQHWSLA
jgi:hypothetical protein